MKKIFTLIAVAAMTISANAQTIDFTAMKDGDFTVKNATENGQSTDNKKIYDIAAGAEMNFFLNSAPDVVFYITNNNAKTKIFVVNLNTGDDKDKGSAEFGGKNGVVYFNTAKVGDIITMYVAAKGGTDGKIGVLPSEGNELIEATILDLPSKGTPVDEGTPNAVADEEGYVWREFKFTVTEDMIKSAEEGAKKFVRVKAGGFRCKAITITAAGGADGIASVKAAKANAAEYNLAGQKVAAGFKGLVIKEGKKVIK